MWLIDVAKPPTFNGKAKKITDFLIACKLFIKIKIRDVVVEEQIQWMLLYVQGELADVQKENIIEDLKEENLEYKTVREFLADLKRKFREEDNEMIKVAELKRVEQGNTTIEEFVQEFRRAVRDSGYEGQLLIEEFKQGMNGIIRQKLMESKHPPRSIEQWYRRATNLNRHWRESRKEEKRLRKRRETESLAPRLNRPANASRIQQQQLLQPQVWLRKQEI